MPNLLGTAQEDVSPLFHYQSFQTLTTITNTSGNCADDPLPVLWACAVESCQVTRAQKKMAEILLGGKRLGELKVTELKAELEKRGLQKYGVKSVLLNRLKTSILREALTQVSCF